MKDAYFIRWRFNFILCAIGVAVVGLSWRIFDLTIFDQTFLRHQGDERVLRMMSTPANRGMIVDRNGFPLAVSTTVYSIWINPLEFSPSKSELSSLSKVLGIKLKDLTKLIDRYSDGKREFAYLKRALSPEEAHTIKALNLPGLYAQKEFRRFYPEGEVTAHILGFTDVDDRGQEGLELAYNQFLDGEPGKQWVIKDRLGRIISNVKTVQEQKPGHDLVLSIDRRIQYLAYRELLNAVILHRASSGTAIVLDVKTGEILAMVNQPSFNPNSHHQKKSDGLRNRAVTDIFEPGSTIKAFSVASALDSGRFKPDTVIDTSPGWMRVGRNVVKDEENHGPMTVTKIMQISSNMGVTKMVLSLPPNQLWGLLHRVGFGELTGIELPGEQNGSLVKHDPWGAFTLATLGFGYGLSVTPIQLTRAYSVIANGGLKIPVTLFRVDKPPVGERVMSAKTTRQMLNLLESVLTKGGTGELARVSGYRVAGKTGTALKVGEHGYQKHRYVSSFVGVAPLTDPRLVVAVIIDDPKGKQYYGGQVSGPVFEKIMGGTLRILDITPDGLEAQDAA